MPKPKQNNEEKTIDAVVDEIHAKAAETPAAKDYTKYAKEAAVPTQVERRVFDLITISGSVDTEIITKDGEEVEKRKPAVASKLLLTKPRTPDNRFQEEKLELPLSIVPIKYRVLMEHRTGSKGEVLVLKSTEYNGKTNELVVISRFSPDGKVIEKYGPMTVSEARNQFKDAEGKMLLRDKVNIYALHNGEVVRFVVKGAGLWEDRKSLVNGKTEASRKEYPYITEYLSKFPMTEPYFLFEMKVDAAHRDHGAVKFYRPIFDRGERITDEVETKVIETLEDLVKYFAEQDKATAEFVPDKPGAAAVASPEEEDGQPDKPF